MLVARALRLLARAGDITFGEALRTCPRALRELPLPGAMQDLFQQPGSPGVLSANTDCRSEGEEPEDYLYEPTKRDRTAVSAILQSASSLSEQDCNLQANNSDP